MSEAIPYSTSLWRDTAAKALQCPGCGGTFSLWLTTSDLNRRVDETRFDYLRCITCGLVRIAEVPADLGKYYPPDYHSLPRPERLESASRPVSYQVDLLRPFLPGRQILEIGPSWGAFAWQARRAGLQVTCIEMDEACCRYLRDSIGVEVHQSNRPEDVLRQLPPQDAIAMWQVLEHLADPWGCLKQAAANLMPGGILAIATPNPNALSLRILRARWPHLDAPRHLWLVPLEVLVEFAGTVGLSLVRTHFTDLGALRLNVSTWRMALANAAPTGFGQLAGYMVGTAVGLAMAPLEMTAHRASSYTAIFRKQ